MRLQAHRITAYRPSTSAGAAGIIWPVNSRKTVWLGGAFFVMALTAGCGGSPATGQTSPNPTLSPATLSCTSGGTASSTWTAPDQRTTTTTPIVSATVSGDTLTLNFDQGTPAFAVTPQATAHFTETNGRGDSLDLAGSAGVLIVFSGFRGDMQNYTGTTSFKPSSQKLAEVREIGDYEGVIGWAAGLNGPGCVNVTSGSSSLAFHFIAQNP